MEALIREELALIETRMANLAERGHEELKEAVRAGLTVMQEEIRMKLDEKGESQSKSREEKKQRLKKLEKAAAGIASEQKTMARTITAWGKQMEDVGRLRGELVDTDGAISELNRTLNDICTKRPEKT